MRSKHTEKTWKQKNPVTSDILGHTPWGFKRHARICKIRRPIAIFSFSHRGTFRPCQSQLAKYTHFRVTISIFRFAVVLRMWSAIHASERRSGTVSKVGSVRLSQLQLRWRARHATYFDGDITSRPLDRRILCVDNISQWPSPSIIHHREGPRRFQIYMYVVKHVETKMIAKAGSSVQLTSFHRRLTTNLNLHQET